MSLRLRHTFFAALMTLTLSAVGCGPTEPAAANASGVGAQAEAAKPESKPEPPIPGANATERAANVRLVLLSMAYKAKGDVAKFTAEAEAFFAERKEGLAQLEVDLAARNKELGSGPDAEQKVIDQAPDQLHKVMKLQFAVEVDAKGFLAQAEVKKRLERIGL